MSHLKIALKFYPRATQSPNEQVKKHKFALKATKTSKIIEIIKNPLVENLKCQNYVKELIDNKFISHLLLLVDLSMDVLFSVGDVQEAVLIFELAIHIVDHGVYSIFAISDLSQNEPIKG